MAKNPKETNQQVFDAKLELKKYVKRALISMLITFPFAVLVSILMGDKASEWVIGILIVVVFLFGFVIGQLIFMAIDKKRVSKPKNPIKERDPFAD